MAFMKRTHIFVSGRVQGVMFRRHAQRIADGLGLAGFAHNLIDGRVELVVEGEEMSIKKIIDWCKKGPPFAKVESIRFEEEKYVGEFMNFDIKEFGF